MSENRGIPTLYAGTRFRSRLEARWAAFFDLAGWRWEYEPIDLDGWIPDFGLIGHDERMVLVEVKPELEATRETLRKVFNAIGRRQYDFMYCGPTLHARRFCSRTGWAELQTCTIYDQRQNRYYLNRRTIWQHDDNGTLDFVPDGAPYTFHFRGAPADGDRANEWVGAYIGAVPDNPIVDLWREASNRVQWRAPVA